MKHVLLLVACLAMAFAIYGDPPEGDTLYLIENFEYLEEIEGPQSCFQHPTYSGTSQGHDADSTEEIVDYRSNWRLDPDAPWYDEEEPGENAVRLEWTWIEDAPEEEAYQMRVTSSGTTNNRNEETGSYQFMICESDGVGFYYYYVGEPVWVAVSVSETEENEEDVGLLEMTQFQELTPEDDWQYIYFDFDEPGMFEDSFWEEEGLGTGELYSAEPALESLFFVSDPDDWDVEAVDLVEDWEMEIFVDDIHYGPEQEPADPPTSAETWSLFK